MPFILSSRKRLACWTRGASAAAVIASAGVVGLTACTVTPLQPRFVGEVVVAAPPPAQVEVMGVAPVPGAVWISGYWNWVGGRHVWTAGRWEAARPGYYWEPHVWVHTGNGWHLRDGRWVRR